MIRRSKASTPARIPNQLWRYRKRMGFSQRQVAALLGYSSPTRLSHYERGGRLPNLVTALKLEIIYRVPVAFLYPEHYARLKAVIREKEERLQRSLSNDEERASKG